MMMTTMTVVAAVVMAMMPEVAIRGLRLRRQGFRLRNGKKAQNDRH
jgi:hypothetical protein